METRCKNGRVGITLSDAEAVELISQLSNLLIKRNNGQPIPYFVMGAIHWNEAKQEPHASAIEFQIVNED
jgi:hypothetical protein